MDVLKKIPIVVLNYNDFDTADAFLKRFESGLKDILSLVFVDNGSTDNSFERLSKKYANLGVFLKNDKNAGYGSGNNVGLKYVRDHMDADKVIISKLKSIIHEYIGIKCVILDQVQQAVIWNAPDFPLS